jgi:hypothetical protein
MLAAIDGQVTLSIDGPDLPPMRYTRSNAIEGVG